jgi:hypothetical protein
MATTERDKNDGRRIQTRSNKALEGNKRQFEPHLHEMSHFPSFFYSSIFQL